ncbi:aromatic ring-hydroxylating oxygenase subunit alpha [Rhizorhabdus argentea]|uniref:aromatic ring-hydroxylating oxygenase subunit alpha n=1 Tax=Rhizorhabdus argentea TaxID=1387174 RepID=UPI0030EF73A2
MNFDELVDLDRRVVSPRVFTDPEVYAREQEQIFARCWQVVGHESELRENNDFVTSWVGEEPVFLTRDGIGKIHVFLNSCMHRGVKVCRAEKGKAKTFTCPYHGWTYRNTGELSGVPRFKESYYGKLEREKWGLIEARVEVLHGLVFASFDKEAPSLDEFLGDMKWYLQFALDRTPGGMEVVGGTEKVHIDANWKLHADQFCGDNYHADFTHRSVLMIFPNADFRDDNSEDNCTIRLPGGHGFYRVDSVTTENPDKPEIAQWIHEVTEIRRSRTDRVRAAMLGPGTTCIFTIFPNLSVLSTPEFTQLRLNLPRGPNGQLLVYYMLCDREAPAAYKAAAARSMALGFSASGIFELDDGTSWAEATATMRGVIRKQKPLNYSMGSGYERLDNERPGLFSAVPNEDTVFGFYRGWREAMEFGPQGHTPTMPREIAAAKPA